MEPLADLRDLIARHARPDRLDTPLAGLKLMASAAPTRPIHNIYQPAFALVAQGLKRATLEERMFEYGAGQYLVVSLDLPISGHVARASAEEPFLGLGLT
ncbi:MAG: AraC family transcriptional regulator, partial [Caulobacteraceae bacterium]